jgi:hypothetical protein
MSVLIYGTAQYVDLPKPKAALRKFAHIDEDGFDPEEFNVTKFNLTDLLGAIRLARGLEAEYVQEYLWRLLNEEFGDVLFRETDLREISNYVVSNAQDGFPGRSLQGVTGFLTKWTFMFSATKERSEEVEEKQEEIVKATMSWEPYRRFLKEALPWVSTEDAEQAEKLESMKEKIGKWIKQEEKKPPKKKATKPKTPAQEADDPDMPGQAIPLDDVPEAEDGPPASSIENQAPARTTGKTADTTVAKGKQTRGRAISVSSTDDPTPAPKRPKTKGSSEADPVEVDDDEEESEDATTKSTRAPRGRRGQGARGAAANKPTAKSQPLKSNLKSANKASSAAANPDG